MGGGGKLIYGQKYLPARQTDRHRFCFFDVARVYPCLIERTNHLLCLKGVHGVGYDLHITRAKFHFENEDQWITAEEWLRFVKEDPELRLAGYNGDFFALWSGKSEYSDPWFDWFEGNVYTKNPDDAMIGKMVEMAKTLNAKVQGDDGEAYVGGGRNNFLPAQEYETDAPPRRSWWKRVLGK